MKWFADILCNFTSVGSSSPASLWGDYQRLCLMYFVKNLPKLTGLCIWRFFSTWDLSACTQVNNDSKSDKTSHASCLLPSWHKPHDSVLELVIWGGPWWDILRTTLSIKIARAHLGWVSAYCPRAQRRGQTYNVSSCRTCPTWCWLHYQGMLDPDQMQFPQSWPPSHSRIFIQPVRRVREEDKIAFDVCFLSWEMERSCHLSFGSVSSVPVLHSLLTSFFATMGNVFIVVRQSLEGIIREFVLLYICQTTDIPQWRGDGWL